MSFVPTVTVRELLLVLVVIGSLLLAAGVLTIGRSLWGARRDHQLAVATPPVREGLFERLHDPEPGWASWVETLSATERRAAEDLLGEYLKRLEGEERERLERLGTALGIPERALEKVKTGDRYEQLQGLTWLKRLAVQVDPEILTANTGNHPDVLAAAARVLHASEHPNADLEGTELLLQSEQSLSVLGLDTLYELNRKDPTPLFVHAGFGVDDWPPALLVQVLQVIGECGPVGSGVSTEWIVDRQDDPSAAIRAAVPVALDGYGWRATVREEYDVQRAIADDSPQVRRAVYEMLGEWGDERAEAALEQALRQESVDRLRVAAAAELLDLRKDESGGMAPPVRTPRATAAWRWVVANREVAP